MTVQTSYARNQSKAMAGMLATMAGAFVLSGMNPSARHVETVTIDTVTNSIVYSITVNGITVSYTSDASATEAEINAGLLAAIAASPWMSALLTAAQGATTATLVLTAKQKNVTLTTTVTAELSRATTVAAGVDLPFGTFVRNNGDKNGTMKLLPLSATGQELAGVVAHSHAQTVKQYTPAMSEDTAGGNDDSGLNPGDVGNVARRGLIWCVAEETMVVTDTVYARHTTTTANGTAGAVRNDADTAKADAVSGAKVLQYDADTGLVLLDLNLP